MQKRKKLFIRNLLIFLIVIVFIIFATIYVLKQYIYPRNHFEIVKKEAKNNNIDPYLVLAVIKTESGFNRLATSNKNAKGLMQIMDSTAEDINKKNDIVDNIDTTNIYNEDINIALGCKYLSNLINKYNGNYYLAICAYNAGMGNVDKWIEQNIIPSDLSDYDIELPFGETREIFKEGNNVI